MPMTKDEAESVGRRYDMKSAIDREAIARCVSTVARVAHAQSVRSGWWHDTRTGEPLERNIPEMLCLIHSEVSEAMEGYRKDLPDDHLTHRKMIEVELADALIRICDLAEGLGLDLGGAVAEKTAYNGARADHRPENRVLPGGKAF